MTYTVDGGFAKLSENLEITTLQKTTVATRQQNVRDAMANGLDVLNSFVTGSYARHTLIGPLKEADIDIFVVIDPKYYSQYTPATLLDKSRRVLLNRYPLTPKISRNGQAVTISFDDFKVDVVPSFNRRGGGYLIPNSNTGTWIETNPEIHADIMSRENANHNNDLVPVCKMIKGWNKNIGGVFRSFYLEMLAIKIFENVRISTRPSGIRYFFDKGRERVRYTITDPAGFGDEIQGLQGISVEEAVKRFETAYTRAVNAEAYAMRNNSQIAYDEWRKIFGNYFPAYG